MATAREADARLIHLPEAALSGYVKSQIKNWADVDWAAVQDELQRVKETACELGIWTVIGCNHRLTAPNRPHNSLFVISDGGEVVGRYDKRFCSQTEITDWYSPGRDAFVFDIDGFRFGCALCIEIQFMEVFAEYERLDADCVLFSAYSDDPTYWVLAQAYAAANNLWLGVSTPAQCGEKMPSGLIGPNGTTVIRCDGANAADIQVVDLDRDEPSLNIPLTKARPWRRKARSGALYASRYVDDPRSEDRLCL